MGGEPFVEGGWSFEEFGIHFGRGSSLRWERDVYSTEGPKSS